MQDSIIDVGPYRFQAANDFLRIPRDVRLTEAIGVAVDSEDRLFVFNRGGGPEVLVFDPDGGFQEAWGQQHFQRPHGITIHHDSIYLTDDVGHSVQVFTRQGRLIRAIGPVGEPSETGVVGFDHRNIHSAGPFNLPTNVAVASDGSVFVADGYGNARIHHFTADGLLVHSWGEPGAEEGQFRVPHGVCVDRAGRVLVADRENSRVQVFDQAGRLLQVWRDVVRPCQIVATDDDVFYVAELGDRNGRFPWQPQPPQPTDGRVSLFDVDGHLLGRLGGGPDPRRPNAFYACHDLSVDSRGCIYVGEVARTVASAAGMDGSALPTLRKFVRV